MKNTSASSLFFAFLFIVLFFQNNLPAQWEPRLAPGKENVYDLLYLDGVWMVISESGFYRSANDGRSWYATSSLDASYASRIGADDANMLYIAEAGAGLHRSADLGQTWTIVSSNATGYPEDVVVTDNHIIYSTYREVYRYDKTNPGAATKVFQTTLQNPNNYLRLCRRNNDIWVAVNDSLLRSDNGGDSWTLVNEGWEVRDLDIHGDVILLQTSTGYRRSDDYGATWQLVNPALNGSNLVWQEGTWFATGWNDGIRYSNDEGVSWSAFPPELQDDYGYGYVAKHGQTILATTYFFGIFRSENNGATWEVSTGGLSEDSPGIFGPTVYPAGNYLVFNRHFSDDGGATWFMPLFSADDYPYFDVPVAEHGGAFYGIDYNRKLYRSDGDFHQWTFVAGPFPQDYNYRFFSTGGHFYRLDQSNSVNTSIIQESLDNGLTWQPTGTSESSTYLTAHNGYLFEWREFSGLFRSQNGGATWQSVGAGLGDLSTNPPFGGPPIYSGGNTLFLFDYNNIYASTNDGLTFTKINNNLLSQWGSTVGADLLVSDGTAVAIISSDNHLYYSPNLGGQWAEISANLPQPDFFYAKLALHGGYLYFAPEYSTGRLWRRPLSGFNLAQLSGVVYRDDNNNGQQDAGELPYTGVLIQAGSSAFGTSTTDGTYDLFADISVNDTLRIVPPSPWVQANPPFYIATGPATGNNFGLYFPPDITDMSVVLTNETAFRPGFDEKIYLTYRNPGTAQASGNIRFYAPAPLEFIAATPAPDQTDGDTLIWDFQNMPPFAEGQIIVTVQVETSTPLGSEVEAFASVQTDEPDANQADNQYLLKEIVLGSFDPNDKRCQPADHITPDQVAAREPLEYTVRFQNTGTYPAEFVRIADTLHQNLDVATFQLLASSHTCQVSVREQGILEFYFDNIDLPPSTFNEPESHGFVKYRILPKPGLSLGAQILNTAHIFFDFNPAIVTNTTSTTVAWPLSTNSPDLPEQALVIFPNPASSSVWIDTGVDEPGRIAFFDVSGALVLAQYTSGKLSKTDIEHLPSGQYIVRWLSETGIYKTGKVLKP